MLRVRKFVKANIKLGRHCHLKTGALAALFFTPAARREEEALRREIEERIIDFLEIDHIRKAPVSALSYGLQKRVELARALAMRPKLLLLDEPVAGMNREETEDMARFILEVRREWGVTVLMVEHDMARLKLRRMKAGLDHEFRALIRQGIAEGSIAPCDPKLAAFTIAGALSWIGHWYRPGGRLEPAAIAEHCIHTLTLGLCGTPALPAARAALPAAKPAARAVAMRSTAQRRGPPHPSR